MSTSNLGLRFLTTHRWEAWHKQAISQVVQDPIFLEPGPDDPFEDLILRADFLFGSPSLSPRVLAESETLKLVHVGSTGVDRYMVPEFQQSGIILVNSRGVHARTVAEHAMAMLLSLSRGFHQAWESRRHCNWDKQTASIVTLPGRVVGLLGLGTIGLEVAAKCKAFGLKVIGIRRNPGPSQFVDKVLPPSGLHEILKESDFVICSLPLTHETRQLLKEKEFSLMKPSAFFINVGRGAVVKEEDLIAALSRGVIKGAGLDVFEEEPLPRESPLWKMSNVIMTPHTAGFGEDHLRNSFQIFVDNLVRYQEGRPLLNVVNKQLGY